MEDKTLTDIAMIDTGEYSDYRTLKPFTFLEAEALYRSNWKQTDDFVDHPSAEEFQGWLVQNGYIEDCPCHEVNIGIYGELKVHGYVADVLFGPSSNAVE